LVTPPAVQSSTHGDAAGKRFAGAQRSKLDIRACGKRSGKSNHEIDTAGTQTRAPDHRITPITNPKR
jgi:hypothetical protein